MSTPATNHSSHISQHLHAAKEILRNVIFDAKTTTTLDQAEFDVLEQDAFEVLRLIRSWRNSVAPVNRIPPEVLTLVPDLWDEHCNRDRGVITLTHVCRAWREVFTSRSSLWTGLDCVNVNKTRVYLERSKSSPIALSLDKYDDDHDDDLSPSDPFFEITPHVIRRLKSLSVTGTPTTVRDITSHLSHPAPLLEDMSIDGGCKHMPYRSPVLTPAFFNGDLSSLRKLCLESVRTKLPWRNMVNLTSFRLAHASPGGVSVGHLLDFFENAPHLHEVDLHFAAPTSGAQNGRLVLLGHLKRMEIAGGKPSSLLLDHLLIPTGATLTTEFDVVGPLVKDHLPRSIDNLGNFSNFSTIILRGGKPTPYIRFSGPNGQVKMIPRIRGVDTTCLLLESLAQFDTSKTERLKIYCINSLPRDPPRQALLPMKDLRTLTLYDYANTHDVIRALDPSACSSGVVVCPKLEELVISQYGEPIDTQDVIEMAAARASRGAKLKSVWIDTPFESVQTDALELKRHVLHVKCGPEVDGPSGDGGGNYEED